MEGDAKLFDAELRLMEALWEAGDLPASDLAKTMSIRTGWNKNTTYTVIKKLIAKGAIERIEPKFVCRALVSRDGAQRRETRSLIDKLFAGSRKLFFASFLENEALSREELDELKALVEGLADGESSSKEGD